MFKGTTKRPHYFFLTITQKHQNINGKLGINFSPLYQLWQAFEHSVYILYLSFIRTGIKSSLIPKNGSLQLFISTCMYWMYGTFMITFFFQILHVYTYICNIYWSSRHKCKHKEAFKTWLAHNTDITIKHTCTYISKAQKHYNSSFFTHDFRPYFNTCPPLASSILPRQVQKSQRKLLTSFTLISLHRARIEMWLYIG